jgi:hypothetical protein
MSLRLPAHWREEADLAIAKSASEATPSINPHRLYLIFGSRQICFRSNPVAHPKSKKHFVNKEQKYRKLFVDKE